MIDNQETQGKIAAEVRDLSRCIKHKMELGDFISVPMPTAFGKPLDVYYAELADRIDAAAKRERDKLTYSFDPTKAGKSEAPDPSAYALEGLRADPDWREICEKCHDGEEPLDCEYFGEPNGCNSPIYGEHPRTQYADMAKMREAVVLALSLLDLKEGVPYKTVSQKDIDFMKAAIAAPARNCDMGTAEEQGARLRRFCLRQKWCDRCPLRQRSMTTQADCKLLWAQLPHKESEAAQ